MKPSIALFEAFSGMGTLTRALADGLSTRAHVRVAGCAELDARYLKHWSLAHPEGSTFQGSFTRFHPSELSVPCPGERRVFVAGIPCTGTSLAVRGRLGLSAAEEHPDVGHLFLPVAHWIRQHRPDDVIFENVAMYPHTLSARCLRAALCAAGYSIYERVLNAYTEFETPTERVRWVLVASRHGQFAWNPQARPFAGTLAEYLDAPSARDDAESFSPEKVARQAAYCARKTEEGCRFFQRFIDHSSTKCPTICATYGKCQPSSTFVRTAKSHRMLRPREVARIHGFPENFALPTVKTTAYQVLGQGVCYRPFYALGAALADHVAGEAPAFSLESERVGDLVLA